MDARMAGLVAAGRKGMVGCTDNRAAAWALHALIYGWTNKNNQWTAAGMHLWINGCVHEWLGNKSTHA
eukprot:5818469-Lingulodinium_polyedra.AAC.1